MRNFKMNRTRGVFRAVDKSDQRSVATVVGVLKGAVYTRESRGAFRYCLARLLLSFDEIDGWTGLASRTYLCTLHSIYGIVPVELVLNKFFPRKIVGLYLSVVRPHAPPL